jgi:sec-independent protein translocase protein TatA
VLQGIGATEIIIIALIILVLFGSKKIPEFIKGIGEGVREFRKGTDEKEEKKEEEGKE